MSDRSESPDRNAGLRQLTIRTLGDLNHNLKGRHDEGGRTKE